jgi:glutamate decarboxylase
MPTFALNFSRPGAQVVAQYYNFVRLGFNGMKAVQQTARSVATTLAGAIADMPEYTLISRGDELPVFAFTTSPDVTGWDVFAVSRGLREHGWQVPAYTFPENRTDLAVLRVVCRHGFTHDLAELFLRDLKSVTTRLPEIANKPVLSGPPSFHH